MDDNQFTPGYEKHATHKKIDFYLPVSTVIFINTFCQKKKRLLHWFIGYQDLDERYQTLSEVCTWHIWLAHSCISQPTGWNSLSVCSSQVSINKFYIAVSMTTL